MPHIIIEYSPSLESQIPTAIEKAHNALAGEGIDIARIKTRGLSINHAIIGNKGSEATMAHITFLLLAGRDIATKKQYGDAILAAVTSSLPDNTKITLEIRDMDPETYYL